MTPAEVATLPSRTKIRSGSTITFGCRSARAAHHAQWVVARRPSSRPAVASSSAPVQTDVDPSRAAREPGDVPHHRGILDGRPHAETAGDEQRVERPAGRLERHVGLQPQAAAGTDLPRTAASASWTW